MTTKPPQAITADQYEPRRVDDVTFAAHDAALGAQIDAHRERAETIEALSVAVAYLATLPVPGYTGTHNPRPQESYDDTAYRLAVILARLAKAHRDIAAHVAARDRARSSRQCSQAATREYTASQSRPSTTPTKQPNQGQPT